VKERNIFLKIYCKEIMYSMSRTSYRIVPLTKPNKYLHYNTSETEMNVNVSVNKSSEEL
jgi:hypothetical protein